MFKSPAPTPTSTLAQAQIETKPVEKTTEDLERILGESFRDSGPSNDVIEDVSELINEVFDNATPGDKRKIDSYQNNDNDSITIERSVKKKAKPLFT